jgi:hypothetical protein
MIRSWSRRRVSSTPPGISGFLKLAQTPIFAKHSRDIGRIWRVAERFGFIEYNSGPSVHGSLLNVVLHD